MIWGMWVDTEILLPLCCGFENRRKYSKNGPKDGEAVLPNS